uniref:Elongation of very long chain fatty acids protein n=1 Tax=Panagrolaimus superbus TaxID=310955 RepID=A0A914Y943_9BILA
MKDFRPFELRRSLQIWNLFLAIFSVIGAYKTGKGLFAEVSDRGLTESYCKKTGYWSGDSGYWTFLFCYSKILEFGDTLFIVLRKKPLIFLHWYHHIATLNYAVLGYPSFAAYNSWIIWLNLVVHSIMYLYYFLAACKIRLPPIVSQIITTLQISQFIITTLILCHVGYLILIGYPCEVTALSYFYCLFMEISYVYLFAKLFHESYVKNGGKKFKQN